MCLKSVFSSNFERDFCWQAARKHKYIYRCQNILKTTWYARIFSVISLFHYAPSICFHCEVANSYNETYVIVLAWSVFFSWESIFGTHYPYTQNCGKMSFALPFLSLLHWNMWTNCQCVCTWMRTRNLSLFPGYARYLIRSYEKNLFLIENLLNVPLLLQHIIYSN